MSNEQKYRELLREKKSFEDDLAKTNEEWKALWPRHKALSEKREALVSVIKNIDSDIEEMKKTILENIAAGISNKREEKDG